MYYVSVNSKPDPSPRAKPPGNFFDGRIPHPRAKNISKFYLRFWLCNNCDVIEMKHVLFLETTSISHSFNKIFIVKGQMNFFNINFKFRANLLPVLVFSYLKLHHMATCGQLKCPYMEICSLWKIICLQTIQTLICIQNPTTRAYKNELKPHPRGHFSQLFTIKTWKNETAIM